MRTFTFIILVLTGAVLTASQATGETRHMTINAEDAHVKTNGTALGPRGWALYKNGYIGIFVHCKTDSKVRVAVRSRYNGASKKGPGVLIRIADKSQTIASKDDWNSVSSQFHLPAGTHFLKIGPAYDLERDTHTPVLDIQSVKVSGGSFDIPIKATAKSRYLVEHQGLLCLLRM